MPAVCLYFQIHQPLRLRKYTVFDSEPMYFDDDAMAMSTAEAAQRCYLPALEVLLDLAARYRGRFRFAMSVTGTAIELLEADAPEVMQKLHALAESGAVEFLGETYHHSLASLYSRPEFVAQVHLHSKAIKRLFGQTPRVFRNTELIYSDQIAQWVAKEGFKAMVAEGWEPALAGRSAAFLYQANGAGDAGGMTLLLRNHALSDAVAFRFSDPRSRDFPLTDDKFVHAVSCIGGQLCNLFLDLETFGQRHASATGIMDFLAAFPGKLLKENNHFLLPSELAAEATPEHSAGQLSVTEPIRWSKQESQGRDLVPWMGNAMQKNALDELFKLETAVKAVSHKPGHAKVLADWRRLTAAEHFYAMWTGAQVPGSEIERDAGRPESPYDAYINFMNVLDNLRARLA